ncbi:GDSL-type esterase/lipase family protein [Leifsonia sp. 2MCAF36]|uniref:GDSL-type esterase/lipase family protein n=1 Tax=Leifsonia sp. 2MCAF36 TaxID=3232988 RepID=UPI003F9CCF5D
MRAKPSRWNSTSPGRPAVRRAGLVAAAVVVGSVAAGAYALFRVGRDHPAQYESRVREIERRQEANRGPVHVLLTGSSYIEYWSTSGQDLSPLESINIGIGGTKVGDHLAYLERMVVPFSPEVVVVYVGSNDINGIPFYSKDADEVVALVVAYLSALHERLPDAEIYYVAITEAPIRARVRRQIQAANRKLRAIAESSRHFVFVDTAAALLNPDGSINNSLFRADRLHLNDEGYRRFASVIRQSLLAS